MENAPNVKKNAVWPAMWDVIQKPLLWVAVMFFASLALIELQDKKATFDKRENAAFVWVNGQTFSATENEVRPAFVKNLVTEVQDSLPPPQEKVEQNGDGSQEVISVSASDAERIIRKGAIHTSFKTLKSKDELMNSLNEGILKQKSEALKDEQDRVDKARKAITEATDQRASALVDLATATSATQSKPVTIGHILALPDKTSPLRTALQKQFSNHRNSEILKPEQFEGAVNAYFDDQIKRNEKVRDESLGRVENIEGVYQLIGKSVFENLASPAKFANIAPTINEKNGMSLILDEKKGLGVLYKIMWVSLMATILFALLYLVLIPLKHLFFWTTSSEVLTDQFKKFLERKDATITPPIIHAVVTGLAVVSVGAAALAASPFPLTGSSDSNNGPADSQTYIQTVAPYTGPTRQGTTTEKPRTDQARINDLASHISALDGSIQSLQTYVQNHPSVTTTTTTTGPDLSGKFADLQQLFGRLIGDPAGTQKPTVFSNLDDLMAKQTAADNALNAFSTITKADLGTLKTNLGKPGDAPNLSLFGGVSEARNTLGTLQLSDDLKVVDSLRNLTRNIGNDPDPLRRQSLFSQTKSVQDSVTALTGVTNSIRFDQGGPTGRNLISQAKTLFSRELYLVNEFTVPEFLRDYSLSIPLVPPDLRLQPVLESLRRSKPYTESELHNAMLLNRISGDTWKNWRSKILKYTRVSRW